MTSGKVTMDGSCNPSPIRGLSRAGIGIVEVDREGNMVREIISPIPAHLAQTPQVAEYVAYAVAVRSLRRESELITDCMGVRNAAATTPSKTIAGRMKHGGIMLDTFRDPQQLRMVKEVKWVKAHRNLQEAASPEEAWLIKANDLADDAAKRAVGLHPQQDLASAAWADFYTRRFPHAVKATAIALAMFPPAAGNLKRHPQHKAVRKQSNGTGTCGPERGKFGGVKCAGTGQPSPPNEPTDRDSYVVAPWRTLRPVNWRAGGMRFARPMVTRPFCSARVAEERKLRELALLTKTVGSPPETAGWH